MSFPGCCFTFFHHFTTCIYVVLEFKTYLPVGEFFFFFFFLFYGCEVSCELLLGKTDGAFPFHYYKVCLWFYGWRLGEQVQLPPAVIILAGYIHRPHWLISLFTALSIHRTGSSVPNYLIFLLSHAFWKLVGVDTKFVLTLCSSVRL